MIVPPPPPVLWGIVAVAAFPAVLLLLSRGPFSVSAPGRRFAVAWTVVVLAWFVLAVLLASRRSDWADYAAALMVIGGAVPLSFIWWSVLCWGFTLNMLVWLAGASRPVSRAEWERGYAGPEGLTHLIADRAGLLFRTGLAVPGDQRSIRLTGRGLLAACLAGWFRRLCSVRT